MTNAVHHKKNLYIGFLFATISVIIWSGNFIVAKGATQLMPPIAINFYRWLCASIIVFPFGYKKFRQELPIIKANWRYFLAVIMAGIIIYNNILYLSGHYTTAINLALIGTSSNSIFSIILASVFLKEHNNLLRIIGLCMCICGVLLLLTGGSFEHLIHFHFMGGDIGIIIGSLFFATYNVLVRKKPTGISPFGFLFVMFLGGAILLAPMAFVERHYYAPIIWDWHVCGIILYIGLGASFFGYICWNGAIARIGSSRTALFGNLIPILSTYEAVLLLHEKVTTIHIISAFIVIAGLVIANSKKANHIK